MRAKLSYDWACFAGMLFIGRTERGSPHFANVESHWVRNFALSPYRVCHLEGLPRLQPDITSQVAFSLPAHFLLRFVADHMKELF